MFPWKSPNFVILPAAHKQGFPRYCRILIMWPWPRPFIWSSWTIVLTPDMLTSCRHIQVYTPGRLSIDGFSFERVVQFNLQWIFSKLDSGFLMLDSGFQSQDSGFQRQKIPGFWNPDSLTWGDIPFTAAHTYIAHIWQYHSPRPPTRVLSFLLLYWIAGIGIVIHYKHNSLHSYIQSLNPILKILNLNTFKYGTNLVTIWPQRHDFFTFPRKSFNTTSPMIEISHEIEGAVQIPHP